MASVSPAPAHLGALPDVIVESISDVAQDIVSARTSLSCLQIMERLHLGSGGERQTGNQTGQTGAAPGWEAPGADPGLRMTEIPESFQKGIKCRGHCTNFRWDLGIW